MASGASGSMSSAGCPASSPDKRGFGTLAAVTTARHIEYMPLNAIVPADRNPKEHDADLISASVKRFGFIETPVLDERTGKLVAGHGRTDELRAAQARGEDPPDGVEVRDGDWWVPVARGWQSASDDEAHAAGVALNRVGEVGGWKWDELYDILDGFSLAEGGLDGLGFERDDLDDMVARMQEDSIKFSTEESYGGGGAHAEPDFDDRMQRYAGKGIRSFVLDYSLADFDEIAATCGRLRRHLNIGTNSDLIAHLVRDAGQTLPEV